MEKFDDFDTQIQIDEIVREAIYSEYIAYPVDCDDGTEGDIIYEVVKKTVNYCV